ncbi:ZP domain-containing protein [Nibea albiflora]|uniref:ZP domain-containing protein n=1 Tax=Nibea albiflora TaxID=240163 RepID=A0ACB7EH61_NIBAL|nr:ZP domain-containing protein [Nibea albiflora]
MASTQVLLLQLLLVALASASHHYGGTVGFTYKGRNPDGTFQGSCTLYYQSASSDSNRVFGFEMVVEDFPLENVILSYSDGSRSSRAPLSLVVVAGGYDHSSSTDHGHLMVVVVAEYNNGTNHNSTDHDRPMAVVVAEYNNGTNHNSTDHDHPMVVVAEYNNSTNHNSTDHNHPMVVVEGHYLPKLVAPTPQHGARIQAEVNKEVEIRVNAQAAYTTIQQIIMSGPLNISKHRTTHNEFVIRWTPTPDNLGNLFPVCFAVESVSGSRIYQSEMRCVLVDVGREHIKSNVICNESTMTVEVEKSSFAGLDEDHLRLSDPTNTACSLQTHSNSTHIIGVIPLNACGTQIEEDEDNLIFKNEITTVTNNQNTITRHHLLEVQFYCQYPKRGNVTLGFTAHRNNITVWEKGFGTFTYNFEFFPDTQYQTMIDPNSYPLECNVDSTIQTYSTTNKRQFRFSMEAFKFIGLHDQVYISCSVMMCEAGNPTQVINLNLNLVFIAGCLLAAVGMVSAVVMYKAKVSRVKYQPLPAFEN